MSDGIIRELDRLIGCVEVPLPPIKTDVQNLKRRYEALADFVCSYPEHSGPIDPVQCAIEIIERMERDLEPNRIVCPECDHMWTVGPYLDPHLAGLVSVEYEFRCPSCGEVFKCAIQKK